jgi:uncharacterized protein
LLPAALLSVEPLGDRSKVRSLGSSEFASVPDALHACSPNTPTLVRPRYLRARDEVWVHRALTEYRDRAGQPRAAFDTAWAAQVEPRLQAAGAGLRGARGLKQLLDRTSKDQVPCTVLPETIRAHVFPLAATGLDRAEVFEQAGIALGLHAESAEAGLFADRLGARLVQGSQLAQGAQARAGAGAGTAAEWVERYNLALVQGLLMRCEYLTVELLEAIRSVVRYAKLRGLLALFFHEPERVRIELSGPLALFRNTLKYGRTLANFFPAVCVAPGYRAYARCRLDTGTVTVVVASGDPIARTHVLPRDVDSAVERALIRDLRRVGAPWSVSRETAALRAGNHLFFPDLTLTLGDRRVFVEVVGFYTQEYLERKLAAVAAAGLRNLVLCVDESLPVTAEIPGAAAYLRYRRRVDAAALLALVSELW